jgi:hypothetical protein
VFDLLFLINNADARLGEIRNDAAAFSAAFTPLIPAAVWAIVWSLLALAMVGVAVYYGIVHPLVRSKPTL